MTTMIVKLLKYILIPILLSPSLLSIAIASEKRIPLSGKDNFGYRSVLFQFLDGNTISGCKSLTSYNASTKEFVCSHVSGVDKTFVVRDVKNILFKLSIPQSQNMVAQQRCYRETIRTPRKKISFLIPEGLFQLSKGQLLLKSSWLVTPGIRSLDLQPAARQQGATVTTLLEPQSLAYKSASKSFLFEGQFVDFLEKQVCVSGGGTGRGGKGGGRSHRQPRQ